MSSVHRRETPPTPPPDEPLPAFPHPRRSRRPDRPVQHLLVVAALVALRLGAPVAVDTSLKGFVVRDSSSAIATRRRAARAD